jgi:hypothetical protein
MPILVKHANKDLSLIPNQIHVKYTIVVLANTMILIKINVNLALLNKLGAANAMKLINMIFPVRHVSLDIIYKI